LSFVLIVRRVPPPPWAFIARISAKSPYNSIRRPFSAAPSGVRTIRSIKVRRASAASARDSG
jgi:hypothetical protein